MNTYNIVSKILVVVCLTILSGLFMRGDISAQWDPRRPMPIEPKPKPQEPAPPKPEERFERERRLGIESFYAEPGAIDYGSEVTLRWRFKSPTDDIRALTTTLEGIHQSGINIPIGREIWRVVSTETHPIKHYVLEGRYTFRPKWKGGYSDFRLTVRYGGGTYQKETHGRGVQVNFYKLEVKGETIQSPEPKVRFYVENKAWEYGGPYNGRLRVNYHITSHPRGALNKSSAHDFGNISLASGGRTTTVEVPLSKEEAFSSNDIRIQYDLVWVSPYPGEGEQSARSESTHRWTPATLTINETIIDIFGSLVSGSIRLNNYNGETSHVTRREPYIANDSYVEIMGKRAVFTPPVIAHTPDIPGIDYRGYLNDINAAIGGKGLFTIQDGKIKLSINFETGGGDEIRGWEFTWGVYHDISAPDVNIGELGVSVFFTPGLQNGRVTYTGVEVVPAVSIRFVGAYDTWLMDRVRGVVENEIRNRIRTEMSNILLRDDIRRRIEDGIAGQLRGRGIVRIIGISAEGSRITISYL